MGQESTVNADLANNGARVVFLYDFALAGGTEYHTSSSTDVPFEATTYEASTVLDTSAFTETLDGSPVSATFTLDLQKDWVKSLMQSTDIGYIPVLVRFITFLDADEISASQPVTVFRGIVTGLSATVSAEESTCIMTCESSIEAFASLQSEPIKYTDAHQRTLLGHTDDFGLKYVGIKNQERTAGGDVS